jgi:hypothetical protein
VEDLPRLNEDLTIGGPTQ